MKQLITMEQDLGKLYKIELTDAEFEKMSSFIYKEYGIKMPYVKKVMLQSRLHKRLRALGMSSFKDYINYVFSKKGQETEVVHMIDVVSTNKTDFFREPAHFDFMTGELLPKIGINYTSVNPLKVWSAACSSGEEPYTLAIILSEYKEKNPAFNFKITGTDISTIVLNKAVKAIYPEDRTSVIPMYMKRKYFLKSKDIENVTVKLQRSITEKVNFFRLNFMDDSYNMADTYDIVFCRNVLIYFDKQTQENVIRKILTKLKPGGFFFMGHSESITGMSLPLQQIKPTIFRKI